MSDLQVLIVPENGRQFNSLSKSLRSAGIGDVYQANGVDDAFRWLGLHHCDACVISYELPGRRNGLDVLLDIRSHRADLPIVMVSRSNSEKVAVGAFHAGVVDYVPINRGYEKAVAGLISQLKRSTANDEIVRAQIIPPNVHDQVLQPTYQNRLRVIGRHLDIYGFRRVNILEVEGGFIVRATPSGNRGVETLEFVSQQFAQLLAAAAANRGSGGRSGLSVSKLIPTGYEDFLRAVGYRLDEHAAEAVTISELEEIAVVGGVGRVDETGVSRYGPIQWLFYPNDAAIMLDAAYQRRQDLRSRDSSKGFLRRITS